MIRRANVAIVAVAWVASHADTFFGTSVCLGAGIAVVTGFPRRLDLVPAQGHAGAGAFERVFGAVILIIAIRRACAVFAGRDRHVTPFLSLFDAVAADGLRADSVNTVPAATWKTRIALKAGIYAPLFQVYLIADCYLALT